MRSEESWKRYLRRIQHYLDSNECVLPGLVVFSQGRTLRLVKDGQPEKSDAALQCLQSAVEYADSYLEPDFYENVDAGRDDEMFEDGANQSL